MAKTKTKGIKKKYKSLNIKKECPALDSECNIIILDIFCKKLLEANSCENYENKLKKIDDHNIKKGDLNVEPKSEVFRKKYNIFSRVLSEDLNDFYNQPIKEQLEFLNEDYNEFIKSADIAKNHIIKNLLDLTTTAESKLHQIKPRQWDLRNTLTQIKFKPLPIKEEPMDQVEISSLPSKSKNSNPSPSQENTTIKCKSTIGNQLGFSINERIRKTLKNKSSFNKFLRGKSTIEMQKKFFSILKIKKLNKYRTKKETELKASQSQIVNVKFNPVEEKSLIETNLVVIRKTLYSSKTSSIVESTITTNTDESILNKSESDDDSDEEEFNESSKEKCDNRKSAKKGSSSASSSTSVTPTKPSKPYLEIIADAILSCEVKMMQLHEIYHYMESKYEYFIKTVNKSWRNSVRHNLSLNECFVKAGRGSNGKGNYWKIHPLCEKEFIRGCFRRKSFKQLIRAGSAHAAANQHQAYQQNHGHNMATYNLPVDYSINFRSMVPPPMPQQFLSSSNNNSVHLNSFQYPVFSNNTNSSVNSAESPQFQSSMQNNSFNSYIKSESIAALNKGSDEFKQQSTANNINNNGFHPYRV